MSVNLDLNTSESLFIGFLTNLGLNIENKTYTEVYGLTNGAIGLSLVFKTPTDVQSMIASSHPMLGYFRDLQERVLNSPLVQSEIKDMQRKIDMANAASDELLERIKELEKYKLHHDLEMELRHGKK